MKKYLFIDTWNGTGYSDSKAMIIETDNPIEFLRGAFDEVSGCEDSFRVWQTTDSNNLNELRYLEENEEGEELNAGALSMVPFTEDMIGVSLSPCVNEFQIFTRKNKWNELLEDIMENSAEYQEEGFFGTCHHEIGEGDCILFSIGQLEIDFIQKAKEETPAEKITEEDLEWFDSGDGVEHEVWINLKTGKRYVVPIEIVRDFDNIEECEEPKSFIEEGRTDGEKEFTYSEAVARIKEILRTDSDLAFTLDCPIDEMDADDLITLGCKYYGFSDL